MAGTAESFSPETDFAGSVKASSTPSPAWRAATSETAAGTGGEGGTGSPGAPQPAARRITKIETRKLKLAFPSGLRCGLKTITGSGAPFFRISNSLFRVSIFGFRILQDVAAEILVLDDVHKLFVDVSGVNFHVLFLELGSLERNLVENLFENSVQAAGADIFGLLIDAGGEAREGGNGIFGEMQLEALGFEERGVLFDERVFRLGKNADEIFFLEGLQLDADGQAALEFGDQIGRLSDVKSPGRDEQDVVGADHAVACVDGSAFDDGEDVALHA